jgi:hypothetical protein
MGEMRKAYKILIDKHDWKRPHRRTRSRWESNIIIDVQGYSVGWCRLDASG